MEDSHTLSQHCLENQALCASAELEFVESKYVADLLCRRAFSDGKRSKVTFWVSTCSNRPFHHNGGKRVVIILCLLRTELSWQFTSTSRHTVIWTCNNISLQPLTVYHKRDGFLSNDYSYFLPMAYFAFHLILNFTFGFCSIWRYWMLKEVKIYVASVSFKYEDLLLCSFISLNTSGFWTVGWTRGAICRLHLGLREIGIGHFSLFFEILELC